MFVGTAPWPVLRALIHDLLDSWMQARFSFLISFSALSIGFLRVARDPDGVFKTGPSEIQVGRTSFDFAL